jgi:hypothetical protein
MRLFAEQTNPCSIPLLDENHFTLQNVTFQVTSSKLGFVFVSFSFRTGLSKSRFMSHLFVLTSFVKKEKPFFHWTENGKETNTQNKTQLDSE